MNLIHFFFQSFKKQKQQTETMPMTVFYMLMFRSRNSRKKKKDKKDEFSQKYSLLGHTYFLTQAIHNYTLLKEDYKEMFLQIRL